MAQPSLSSARLELIPQNTKFVFILGTIPFVGIPISLLAEHFIYKKLSDSHLQIDPKKYAVAWIHTKNELHLIDVTRNLLSAVTLIVALALQIFPCHKLLTLAGAFAFVGLALIRYTYIQRNREIIHLITPDNIKPLMKAIS